MRTIVFNRAAQRALDRIPANIADLIMAKLERYAADPSELANNVRSLKGTEGLLRMRIGDWRVLFKDSGTVVSVSKIASRCSVYE